MALFCVCTIKLSQQGIKFPFSSRWYILVFYYNNVFFLYTFTVRHWGVVTKDCVRIPITLIFPFFFTQYVRLLLLPLTKPKNEPDRLLFCL